MPEQPVHRGPAPSHPYPIFRHKGKKNFVDFDEDLHERDFVNAHREGFDNVELLKRYTAVGMGPSQGKLSNLNAARIHARLNGRSLGASGTTTYRPFHHPVSLNHLAGRRFHPLRRTAMHDWHARAGAHFIHVGPWLRPEYYRDASHGRENCILREARNVRQHVGLIDVGTLGKLEIAGPDAVAFLERMYTGRFAKQKVGRLRYGVACDESGVVIQDGVIVRLAEDHYYVTATTTGVAGFYREMQRWALLWRMNVVLVDATGQLAAMNIAGPQSREVLGGLTDVDLSPEAYPYLGVREGKVAGVPARLLRVGFVGELGYEVHVPASGGLHVWSQLMEAGKPHDIRPFGVEAQRLLRLEKGHLIVGQDTDALTNPDEADVAWAIGKNKDFFVGQRSLTVVRQRPATRRLVGFRLAKDHPGPFPEECHLFIKDSEMIGRVTSIAHRSTLGYPLGLALLPPEFAEPGTRVQVRVDGGVLVEAEVTAIPFYDPENVRQS